MLVKQRLYPKKEKDFINEFMKELKYYTPYMWYFKSHGQPMQVRGIPDIVACIDGIFYGLEFKIMRKGQLNVTPYQQDTLNDIFKAKGAAFVIWWDERTANIGIQTRIFKGPDALNQAIKFFLDEIKFLKKLVCAET